MAIVGEADEEQMADNMADSRRKLKRLCYIFDEDGVKADIEGSRANIERDAYIGNTINFLAMVQSLEQGRMFTHPVVISCTTLLLQLIFLNGVLAHGFARLDLHQASPIPMVSFPEHIARLVATIVIMPLTVVAKLGQSGEYTDSSIFLVVLTSFQQHAASRPRLLALWATFHSARIFLLIPLYIAASAQLLSQSVRNQQSLISMAVSVLSLSYVLELDDKLYTLLYRDRFDNLLDTTAAPAVVQWQLGPQSCALATRLRDATLAIITLALTVLVAARSSSLLSAWQMEAWAVPLIGAALFLAHLLCLPLSRMPTRRILTSLALGALVVYCTWLVWLSATSQLAALMPGNAMDWSEAATWSWRGAPLHSKQHNAPAANPAESMGGGTLELRPLPDGQTVFLSPPRLHTDALHHQPNRHMPSSTSGSAIGALLPDELDRVVYVQ